MALSTGPRDIPGMFDGSMSRLLLRMAAPVYTGMLVQLLYSITDTVFISMIDKSDPSYVAGTGLVFPLVFLAMAAAGGIMTGVASVVARSIGERNHEALDRTAESGLAIAVVFSLLFVSLGYLFGEHLVGMLGAQGDLHRHGLDYFYYMLPFAAIMMVMHTLAGILQGEGRPKHIMGAMVAGTVVNVALDPLFILVLDMKVIGAALASVIGQGVALGYVLWVFASGRSGIRIHWKLSNIDPALIWKIIVIGFPMTMGQAAMAISMLLFNRIIVDVDAFALAAFALVGRFDQVVIMPSFALSSALITVVGQNVGRGLIPRVRLAWKTSLFMGWAVVLALATVMVLIAPWLYRQFTDVPEVLYYCVRQTRFLTYSFLFAVIGILGRSVFQAIGFPIPALILTIVRTLAIGVPLAAILTYSFDLGITGVYLGILIGNSGTAGVGIIWILSALRRLETGTLKAASVS